MVRGLSVCLALVYIASASPNPQGGSAQQQQQLQIIGLPDAQLIYKYTGVYTPIWNPDGSGSKAEFSLWQVKPQSGYCSLGDVAVGSYGKPTSQAILVKKKDGATAPPYSFTRRYHDAGNELSNKYLSVWKMNAPGGYRCLGDAAVGGKDSSVYDQEPDKSHYCCVKEFTGNTANTVLGQNKHIYNDEGTGAYDYLTVFGVIRGSGTGVEGGNFVTCEDNTKWCDPNEVETGYLLNGENHNVKLEN